MEHWECVLTLAWAYIDRPPIAQWHDCSQPPPRLFSRTQWRWVVCPDYLSRCTSVTDWQDSTVQPSPCDFRLRWTVEGKKKNLNTHCGWRKSSEPEYCVSKRVPSKTALLSSVGREPLGSSRGGAGPGVSDRKTNNEHHKVISCP